MAADEAGTTGDNYIFHFEHESNGLNELLILEVLDTNLKTIYPIGN